MGDVYLVVRADGQFDKEVAIKLVRGGLDSSFALERIRIERQILAGLGHPNIARLLDGGTTEDGLPYLVMELVAGVPIDCNRWLMLSRWSSQYYSAQARGKLPPKRRLEMWRDAKGWYQKSMEEWTDLQQHKTLDQEYAKNPAAVATQISQCDRAIEQLGQ